jgi:hypothetical protein
MPKVDRNKSAASAWTDVKLAETRARRGGRFDGRRELGLALLRGGFVRDSRAREAYSLPGQEGDKRVDLGGDRSKSARFEEKFQDAWRGRSDTIYFGYIRSAADAEGWARHLHGLATGRHVPHPPIPKKAPPKPETVARRAETAVRKESARESQHGRGFYVVNSTTAGIRIRPSSSVSRLEPGGLYSPLAANHGPFATLDEALPVAWRQFQDYLQQRFTYLLPVQVVEARSREAAERGEGYVWWTDGKARGAPVPKEQASLGFAGRSHLLHTFGDLPVGATFWFDAKRTTVRGATYGQRRGPYVKVDDRRYRDLEDVAGRFLYEQTRRDARVSGMPPP